MILAGIAFLTVTTDIQARPADLNHRGLWYDEEAGNDWTAALPNRNGRLGAMILGNVPKERIQLNEDTLYYLAVRSEDMIFANKVLNSILARNQND